MLGIGNVCVDTEVEHKGFGRLLMDAADIYILEQHKNGVLLCKSKVKGFYEKCGWSVVESKNVKIGLYEFCDYVMTDKPSTVHKTLAFNRNF